LGPPGGGGGVYIGGRPAAPSPPPPPHTHTHTAGALRDNGRAVVIGERTFGKGVVQYYFPMGDGSGIKLTVAKYLTPSRFDISREGGLTPDVACSDHPRGGGGDGEQAGVAARCDFVHIPSLRTHALPGMAATATPCSGSGPGDAHTQASPSPHPHTHPHALCRPPHLPTLLPPGRAALPSAGGEPQLPDSCIMAAEDYLQAPWQPAPQPRPGLRPGPLFASFHQADRQR